ncbi:MAG: hypothetical protein IJZ95_05295 [Oscillospiraceae bacterium]|nr:hypothetical protein [Oscillospiraceae bacterium]
MIQLNTGRKAELKHSNLFFIELMLVLLFFSISAAVILQLFVAADNRQKQSDRIEMAVICAQSVAEAFSVSGSLADCVGVVFGGMACGDDIHQLEVKLNDDFAAASDGNIILSLSENEKSTQAGTLSRLEMTFEYNEEEFYTIGCTSYTPRQGGVLDG